MQVLSSSQGLTSAHWKQLFCHWFFAEVHIYCCGFTEAVIRLVLSALVGVAAVAVLVYDIRSTRGDDKKQISHIL